MQYTVVRAMTFAKITEVVNDHIRQGWKVQGGVAVGHMRGDDEFWYFQALVK
jgi:hypothetical protein